MGPGDDVGARGATGVPKTRQILVPDYQWHGGEGSKAVYTDASSLTAFLDEPGGQD